MDVGLERDQSVETYLLLGLISEVGEGSFFSLPVSQYALFYILDVKILEHSNMIQYEIINVGGFVKSSGNSPYLLGICHFVS